MAVIAIDLDHTLVEGDKAIKGAKDGINLLREQGHKIIINTCNDLKWAEKVLNNNDIRFDFIWGTNPKHNQKVLADCYLDDKAVRFTGDWGLAVSEITDMVKGLDNRKADGIMCGGKMHGVKL